MIKTDCSNYRGISLFSTTYKILSNILLSRLTPYAEEIIRDPQYGFQCSGATTDHILCIYQILEKKNWRYWCYVCWPSATSRHNITPTILVCVIPYTSISTQTSAYIILSIFHILTWISNFYLNLIFYICKLNYLDIIYPSKDIFLKVATIGGQNM